jgi:hypothetical protein
VVAIYVFVSCCSFLFFFLITVTPQTLTFLPGTPQCSNLRPSTVMDWIIYILPDNLSLIQKRSEIIHSAALLLEKCQLVRYDRVLCEYTFA